VRPAELRGVTRTLLQKHADEAHGAGAWREVDDHRQCQEAVVAEPASLVPSPPTVRGDPHVEGERLTEIALSALDLDGELPDNDMAAAGSSRTPEVIPLRRGH
jgi:hypothetical protein